MNSKYNHKLWHTLTLFENRLLFPKCYLQVHKHGSIYFIMTYNLEQR
jgi:hypothetical protein